MTIITYLPAHGLTHLGPELGSWMDPTDATTDLTGNTKDLTLVGTLTKQAVNTNASSFEYTNFSTSNYLERAYDVDFDLIGLPSPAVGHALIAWVNVGTVSGVSTIIDRYDTAGTGARYSLNINASGMAQAVISDGTDTLVTDGVMDLTNSGWNQIVVTWDDAGTQSIYINGSLDVSDNGGAAVGSIVNASAVFRIGLTSLGTLPCEHGVTMTRVLFSTITTTQIQSIYETEKIIFKINSTYVQQGINTPITFPSMQIDRSQSAVRSDAYSIGGNRQTLFNRADTMWSIVTSELLDRDVNSFELMLSTLMKGTTFSLDPYELGEPVQCKLDNTSYATSRLDTSNYFTFELTVREL